METMIRFLLFLFLIVATGSAEELQTFHGCVLLPTEWADGDSFLVRFPDGVERTLRLYAVDCIELHVTSATDARRLRSQRRYFGISQFGGGIRTSVAVAHDVAGDAATTVQSLLKEPFSVITAFADGRGDGRHHRYYAFVETADQKDLAEELVTRGLARALGVYRRRSPDVSHTEYRARMKDFEMRAAIRRVGVWKYTDWDSLPIERRAERREVEELELARQGEQPDLLSVNPNTAPRDVLMRLPGVGEEIANRIIEGREDGKYKKPNDLARVSGIGPKTVERLRAFLRFE